MKRKILSMVLAASMMATMVVGCGSKDEGTTDANASTDEAADGATDTADATGDTAGEVQSVFNGRNA